MPEEHWNLEANEEAGWSKMSSMENGLKHKEGHHCKNCKCKPLTKIKEDKNKCGDK